jgi:hypothetical protein
MAHTHRYRGRCVKLVPNEQIVEVDELETSYPGAQDAITIAITLVRG